MRVTPDEISLFSHVFIQLELKRWLNVVSPSLLIITMMMIMIPMLIITTTIIVMKIPLMMMITTVWMIIITYQLQVNVQISPYCTLIYITYKIMGKIKDYILDHCVKLMMMTTTVWTIYIISGLTIIMTMIMIYLILLFVIMSTGVVMMIDDTIWCRPLL